MPQEGGIANRISPHGRSTLNLLMAGRDAGRKVNRRSKDQVGTVGCSRM